jgi:hypothetical protein
VPSGRRRRAVLEVDGRPGSYKLVLPGYRPFGLLDVGR